MTRMLVVAPALAVWLLSTPAAWRTGRESAAISIQGFQFEPAEVTVAAGDTVVWTNTDGFIHSVEADSGAWKGVELRSGDRFTFEATSLGRFSYHCTAHPIMRGTLIVASPKRM